MSDHVMTLMGVTEDTTAAAGVTAEENVMFPPEVQAAIEAVLPSDDPLDSPNLDVVGYINTMFPTEQSLTGTEIIITLNYRVSQPTMSLFVN